MRYFLRIVVLAIVFCSPCQLMSQNNEGHLLEEIRAAYNQLKYVEAEIKAKAALEKYENFTPSQLTEIHKLLGLVYYSQNKPIEARRHFEAALNLTPDLELDPMFVSPKIVDFFKQIHAERDTRNHRIENTDAPVRYVVQQDPRPAAALRSMLLPGWGQYYKGEKNKAWLLAGLWTAGITGTIISHFAREEAEDRYLSETSPDDIVSRYNRFNTFHKLRNNLFLFSAGIWLFSYIDAMVKKQPLRNEVSTSAKHQIHIFPTISPQQTNLSIRVDF